VKQAECLEKWTLKKCVEGKVYVIDINASTPNITYGDSFSTNVRYCLTLKGQSTVVCVHSELKWLKPPLGFIKSAIKGQVAKTLTEQSVSIIEKIKAKAGVQKTEEVTPTGGETRFHFGAFMERLPWLLCIVMAIVIIVLIFQRPAQ
jgi:hypothetical protein